MSLSWFAVVCGLFALCLLRIMCAKILPNYEMQFFVFVGCKFPTMSIFLQILLKLRQVVKYFVQGLTEFTKMKF